MKQQNFFDDPKGILEEIQQQSRLLQQRQQQPLQELQQHQQAPPPVPPPPQFMPQPRRRLSTFTAPSIVQASPSTPLTTIPSHLAYPSSSSLGSGGGGVEHPYQQQMLPLNRRPKPGILRLDVSKPRRSSGGSVEFRMHPHMFGAVSFLSTLHPFTILFPIFNLETFDANLWGFFTKRVMTCHLEHP